MRMHPRTPLRTGLYLTSNHSELSFRDTQHWYNDHLFVRNQLLSLTYLEVVFFFFFFFFFFCFVLFLLLLLLLFFKVFTIERFTWFKRI